MSDLAFVKQDFIVTIFRRQGWSGLVYLHKRSKRFLPSNSTLEFLWRLSYLESQLSGLICFMGLPHRSKKHSVTQSLNLQVVRRSLVFGLWMEFRQVGLEIIISPAFCLQVPCPYICNCPDLFPHFLLLFPLFSAFYLCFVFFLHLLM